MVTHCEKMGVPEVAMAADFMVPPAFVNIPVDTDDTPDCLDLASDGVAGIAFIDPFLRAICGLSLDLSL